MEGLYFLTLADLPEWAIFIKNGKQIGSAIGTKKPTGNSQFATNNKNGSGIILNDETCTDWYWVTTWSDGSQTWDYAFTTCGDEATVDFPNDGGAESLNSVSSLQPWKVVWGDSVNWAVYSTEKLTGMLNPTTKKGYFITINHSSFQASGGCTFTGDALPALKSSTEAKCEVTGTVGFGGWPSDINIGKVTNTFNFKDISW